MKKILFLALSMSLLFTSCGSLRLTPEEKKAIAAQVAQAVNTREMTIDITGIANGPSNTLSVNKEYSIQLDGKHITTYLPFFGKARSGGISELLGEASVVLTHAEVFNFGVDRSNYEQKSEYFLAFQVYDDTHTLYTFNITLFDNGEADIILAIRNKTSMRYYGVLSFETGK